MDSASIAALLPTLTAIGGLLVTVFGYLGYQNRRARLTAIRQAFTEAVSSLAADDDERRLAAAILLRRFFDKSSELGFRTLLPVHRRAPYAAEAVGVIAAVLRGQQAGNFQKLLADGLAYAPDLAGADLQKTNLQNAYLAPKRKRTSLKQADFYRADLSGASLKGASAEGAIFYQARLSNAVLKGADLRKANFYQADLNGARFDGAILTGALFQESQCVPQEIARHLNDEGVYTSTKPIAVKQSTTMRLRKIFLSAPSRRSLPQQLFLDRFVTILEHNGLTTERLDRSDYPMSGQLTEVRRRISDCCGVVVLGFPQDLTTEEEAAFTGDGPTRRTQGVALASRWNDAEAGMAFALDLPLLVLAPVSLDEGIFDKQISERSIFRLPLSSDLFIDTEPAAFREWVATVGERTSRAQEADRQRGEN